MVMVSKHNFNNVEGSQLDNYQVNFANEDSLYLSLIYIVSRKVNPRRKLRAEVRASHRIFMENDEREPRVNEPTCFGF